MSNIVKRLVKSNYTKIESDARVALPDNTLFELIQYHNSDDAAVMVVRAGLFSGTYRIVKVGGPRWLGDNGYTFERDINALDTIVLNERYSAEDYAQATDDHDVRDTHFARLAAKIARNRIID